MTDCLLLPCEVLRMKVKTVCRPKFNLIFLFPLVLCVLVFIWGGEGGEGLITSPLSKRPRENLSNALAIHLTGSKPQLPTAHTPIVSKHTYSSPPPPPGGPFSYPATMATKTPNDLHHFVFRIPNSKVAAAKEIAMPSLPPRSTLDRPCQPGMRPLRVGGLHKTHQRSLAATRAGVA